MSRKRILNITTVKKRDNMMPYTNMITPQGTPDGTYVAQAAIIGGQTSGDVNVNHPRCILWRPTGRDVTTNTGTVLPRVVESARTSSTPYMVGLREIVELQSGNGVPWQWRRICFTFKGSLPGSQDTPSFRLQWETNSGWMRAVNQVTGDRNSGAQYELYRYLFAGQNASDWNDPMVAKLDYTRVTVKYDKLRSIGVGNESGFIRRYKHYHPMNATLAYDDDENGQNIEPATYSVQSKVGMGDYYVMDLFRSRFAAGTDAALVFNPSATLYWHEK